MRISILMLVISLTIIGYANIGTVAIIEESPTSIASPNAEFIPYKFIKITDTQQSASNDDLGPRSVYELVESVLEEQEIEFLLHTGDLVEWGAEQNDYDTYYWPYMETINGSLPIYHVAGNHDYKAYNSANDDKDLDTFRTNVDNPGNEVYYSFNSPQGDTHFIALNSEYYFEDINTTRQNEQMNWLISDLTSNTIERIVVMIHRGLYGTNPGYADNREDQRGRFEDIFVEYGVDIVLQGHDHLFYYSHRYGIDYLTSGCAATTIVRPIPNHPTSLWQEGDMTDEGNHISIFEATENGFNVNITFTNGTSFEFSIENPIIDSIPPKISAPSQVTAYEETNGYMVSWVADDDFPNNFTIYQNDTEVFTGNWTNRYPITYSLDELSVGTYNFTLIVNDKRGYSSSSEVVVEVLAGEAPVTTTTTTSTTTTTTSDASTPGFELITLAVIIGTYFLSRKRRRNKN